MEQLVNSNNESGFTLIEFCVAVVIMMVGLLGLLQAVNMATVHNLGSVLRNEAVSIADDRMVRAKSSVYDATSFNTLVSDTASPANLVSRSVRSGFCNYSVVLSVTTAGSSAGVATSKQLTTTVSWKYKGNRKTHAISSVVVNPNP